MILKFRYGFVFNDVLYGFNDKKLFRFPQNIGLRSYPLKELPKIKVGNKEGYLLHPSKRKSMAQIRSMLIFIDKEVQVIEDKDVLF